MGAHIRCSAHNLLFSWNGYLPGRANIRRFFLASVTGSGCKHQRPAFLGFAGRCRSIVYCRRQSLLLTASKIVFLRGRIGICRALRGSLSNFFSFTMTNVSTVDQPGTFSANLAQKSAQISQDVWDRICTNGIAQRLSMDNNSATGSPQSHTAPTGSLFWVFTPPISSPISNTGLNNPPLPRGPRHSCRSYLPCRLFKNKIAGGWGLPLVGSAALEPVPIGELPAYEIDTAPLPSKCPTGPPHPSLHAEAQGSTLEAQRSHDLSGPVAVGGTADSAQKAATPLAPAPPHVPLHAGGSTLEAQRSQDLPGPVAVGGIADSAQKAAIPLAPEQPHTPLHAEGSTLEAQRSPDGIADSAREAAASELHACQHSLHGIVDLPAHL